MDYSLLSTNYSLMKTLPRGLRNNNPLNIRHSASRWQGARVEQTDKAFVQFTSMTMGYRAAWRILETNFKHFETQHQPFTPRNIIFRWAPPDENDSEAYLRQVCQLTNLAGNEALARPSKASPQSTEYREQSTTAMRCASTLKTSKTINSAEQPPLLNDAYTLPSPQIKAKLIDLLAAMTCIENGISMSDVDRQAIENGYQWAF